MQLPTAVGSVGNLSGGFGPLPGCPLAAVKRSPEPMQLTPGRGSFAEACRQTGRLFWRTTPRQIRAEPSRAEQSTGV